MTMESSIEPSENRGKKRSASEVSNFQEEENSSSSNNNRNDKGVKDTANGNGEGGDSGNDSTGTYRCLSIVGDHKRAVSCVSFAPTIHSKSVSASISNQNVICASASADGSVRLWDITNHINDDVSINTYTSSRASISTNDEEGDAAGSHEEEDQDMEMEEGTKTTATESTTTSASSSKEKNVYRLINPVAHITGHSRGINDLAWSPRTPNLLATASDDKTLRIWDVTRSSASSSANTVGQPSTGTGSAMHTNTNTPTSASGGMYKPDGGIGDATDNFNDALVEFKGHSNFCFSVKFSPQGNLLVSGSFDETVKVWDVRMGECVSTLPAHSDPVTGVDFNRDGTCIVSSSHDGLMRIWDVATGECLKTIYAEGNPPVTFVKYSPNGKFVLSGMLDGRLRLWNVMMGSRDVNLHHYPAPEKATKNYLSIGLTSAQGRGGQCTKTYAGHLNSKYCIFSAFSVANPNRQSIVTGSEDGKVYVYDLQTRMVRQVLKAHDDACLAVAAHDSREIIASGGMSDDRLVKFWVPN